MSNCSRNIVQRQKGQANPITAKSTLGLSKDLSTPLRFESYTRKKKGDWKEITVGTFCSRWGKADFQERKSIAAAKAERPQIPEKYSEVKGPSQNL